MSSHNINTLSQDKTYFVHEDGIKIGGLRNRGGGVRERERERERAEEREGVRQRETQREVNRQANREEIFFSFNVQSDK